MDRRGMAWGQGMDRRGHGDRGWIGGGMGMDRRGHG